MGSCVSHHLAKRSNCLPRAYGSADKELSSPLKLVAFLVSIIQSSHTGVWNYRSRLANRIAKGDYYSEYEGPENLSKMPTNAHS